MGNLATGCDVESGCFAARTHGAELQSHCECMVEEVPPGTAQNCVRQTVIIFDWDDTLMCSHEIKSTGGHVSEHEIVLLQAAVRNVLLVALELGRTCIVTNANMAWVHSTANIFMPALIPVLAHVDMRSVRLYDGSLPPCKIKGKYHVFKDVCGSAHDSQDSPRTKEGKSPRISKQQPSHMNLVVLGDSDAEIEAGAMVGRRALQSFVKTVRFKSYPTCSELSGQLLAVARHLKDLVAENMSRHLELVVEATQPGLWYMVEKELDEEIFMRTPRAAHCL